MPLSWWNMLGGLFRTPCHEVGDQPLAEDFAARLEFLSFSDPNPFMSAFLTRFFHLSQHEVWKKMEQTYFRKVLKNQSICFRKHFDKRDLPGGWDILSSFRALASVHAAAH